MAASKIPFSIGLRAARANLLPGLILQALMIAIVLAYYFHPPARDGLQTLAEVKGNGGLLFSAIASLIAGALLPMALKILTEQRGRFVRENLEEILFLGAFWTFEGVSVDLFYRGQTWLFGAQVDFVTVLKKVLLDQLVYTPFYATPFGMACYEWRNYGYARRGFSSAFTWTFFKERSLPALIACWGVWVPAVAAIYSLPPLLQFPLFSLALTFWVGMFSYINAPPAAASSKLKIPLPS